jgi:prepilin-type N-terminal cleavage/methylation domain-containing protein
VLKKSTSLNSSKYKLRGFTLIELGIVIGVMAILATVVLMGKGFIDAAKQTKAMQTINSLVSASRTYAKQVNGGVSYETVSLLCMGPDLASGGVACGTNILPSATVENPWGLADCEFGVQVESIVPFTSVIVSICVPNGTVGLEMNTAFASSGIAGGCIAGAVPCTFSLEVN